MKLMNTYHHNETVTVLWWRYDVKHSFEFNGGDSFVHRLRRAYRGRTSTGTQEQFWPDALPAATNDS